MVGTNIKTMEKNKKNSFSKWTDKLIKTKKIAVIGGGPGGLSIARLLQLRGGDVYSI